MLDLGIQACLKFMFYPIRLASSSFSHDICVQVGQPPIDRFNTFAKKLSSFIFLYTGNMWNSLPPSIFSFSYSLSSFKCRVYRHLRCIALIEFFLFLVSTRPYSFHAHLKRINGSKKG